MYRASPSNVYPSWSQRIRIASKTYTFCIKNVYVSSVKRIRFVPKTYTFGGRSLYLSCGEAFRKRKTHLTLPLCNVSDRSKDNQLETP